MGHIERDRIDEGLGRHAGGLARGGVGVGDAQAARPVLAVPFRVEDAGRAAPPTIGFRLEALHRARQLEVEARPALGGQRRQPLQRPPDVGDRIALDQRVADHPPAVGGGQVQPVGHRPAPVRARSKPASPLRMPIRQPTLPELQSVSQPAVLVIIRLFWKSSPPYSSPRMIRAWLGTMWQLPPYLS